MKASDLFVKCLEKEKVTHIFGVPGEENEDLLFSLEKSSITFVSTRHEQGASFIADVHGRITGKAGVCLATLGPGATNLITGVADANLDKSPLVAITGQGSSERIHKESHQYLDIVSMFKPITKWNAHVSQPSIIPEIVRKAFKLSEMEKPGATHIELPEDVAKMTVNNKPIEPKTVRRPHPDHKAIVQALKLLYAAKKPMIIAGNGAIRKLASKHLRKFVEHTGIPVASTFMGKGAISDEDPHSLMTVGFKSRDYTNCAVEEADLIIAIGYDLAEYAPEAWNGKKDKKIIHIDFSPAEVYEYYQPEIEIVADISGTLWDLNQQWDDKKSRIKKNWSLPLRKALESDIKEYTLNNKQKMTVPGALIIIRDLLDEEDILISDVGAHKMWIARNYPVYTPNSCIISNGLASMGISLPGGIAAKLARPEKKVVSVMGDGGFLMNVQEIETAKRLNTPFVIIVFVDNDYGLISWKQKQSTGKSTATKFTNPDLTKLAESFGILSYHSETAEDFRRDLEDALSREKLALIAVPIDASINMTLSNKMKTNKCINTSR